MFQVNPDLIAKAARAVADRRNIYWILGGACAGKSTICRALAERAGIAVYDMDAHIYDSYSPRYTAERHPATTAWLSAENPLAWALELAPGAQRQRQHPSIVGKARARAGVEHHGVSAEFMQPQGERQPDGAGADDGHVMIG